MKATKADANLECEECEEENFEMEGFDSSLDGEEGVISLLLAITPLLDVED